MADLTKEELKQFTKFQQAELDGVEAYKALAGATDDEYEKEVFLKLAADEGRHAAFFRGFSFQTVKGYPARDGAEKNGEHTRSCWRNGIPSVKIGIVFTFLCILAVLQDLIRDGVAVPPVFRFGFGDRHLVSLFKKCYDLFIIQELHLPLTLIVEKIYVWLHDF